MNESAEVGAGLLTPFGFAFFVVVVLLGFLFDHEPPAGSRIARLFRHVLVGMIYVLAISFVLHAFMTRWGFRGDDPRYGLKPMLEHTAGRPFVYRVLSPTVVNAGVRAVPRSLSTREQQFLLERSPLLRYRRANESWNLEKSLAFHVAYAYLLFCLVGLVYATRYLTQLVYPGSLRFADLAAALALLALPLTFLRGGYLYDFAELLLLVLCLIAIGKKQWLLLYPAFVAGVLNKESSVLVGLFCVAFAWPSLSRRERLAHAVILGVVGGSIVVALRLMFQDLRGSSVEFRLAENVRFWLDARSYLSFHGVDRGLVPVPRGANLVLVLLLALLVGWAWAHKPPAVKRLLVVSAACNVPLFLLFSYRDEMRAMSLTFPAIYLAACHSVQSLYSTSLRAKSAGTRTREPTGI